MTRIVIARPAGLTMAQAAGCRLCLTLIFMSHTAHVTAQSTYTQSVQMAKTGFNSYNPENRPDELVNVGVSFTATSITDLVKSSGYATITGWFTVTWNDVLFMWSLPGTPGYIFYKKSSMWTPRLVVFNAINGFSLLGDENEMIRIGEDGVVRWEPGGQFRVKCDVTKTSLLCKLKLASWTYADTEVALAHHGTTIDTSQISVDENYSLKTSGVDTATATGARGTFNTTYLIYTFNIDKTSSGSQTVTWLIVVTYLLLSYTHLLVFTLSVETGDKMAFSVNLLMALAVYLVVFSATLEFQADSSSRNVSHLEIHMFAMFALTVLETIFNAVVVRIYSKHVTKVPLSDDKQASTRKLARLSMHSCFRRSLMSNNNVDSISDDHEAYVNRRFVKKRQTPSKTRISPAIVERVKNHIQEFDRIKSASSTGSTTESQDLESSPSNGSHDSATEFARKNEIFTWADIAAMWGRVFFVTFFLIRAVTVIVCFSVILASCGNTLCVS